MKNISVKLVIPATALVLALSFLLPQADAVEVARQPSTKPVVDAHAVMDTYCISCHGPDKQKGSVRFDQLETIDPVALQEIFARVKEVVDFEEMPPAKSKQPSTAEREALVAWLNSQLSGEAVKKLEDKLKKPAYANYVDHEDLFSGKYADEPAFTRDRRWLISEFIFDAKMQRITENRTTNEWQGKRVDVLGGHNIRDLSLANPFLLPDGSGVRYYANTDLTGGHLSTMLSNALKTSIYITENLIKNGRNNKYLPVVREVFALEDQHDATLIARREFLEKNIATVCQDIYGDKNATLLPRFVPVKLKAKKEYSAEDTKKDKRLPVPVARGTLDKSGGWDTFVQVMLDPANKAKSDEEIVEICERIWFNYGDFELDIQGRVSILRDYISDFRKDLATDKRAKRDQYKPLDDTEMQAVAQAIRKHRA